MRSDIAPRWLRAAAALLAVPQLVTGLWAVTSPRGWFEDFPGWSPALVAAEPPYNAHLATDTGAGFLAVGVALAAAAALGSTAALRVALLALLAFSVPHLIYHWAHPSPRLSDSQDVFNVVVLAVEAALPVLLLFLSRNREDNS